MYSLPWLAQDRGAAGFKESGLIEWLQFNLIVLMCLLFLREAFATRKLRELCIIFACFLAFVAIREMDSYFDRIPWLSWKVGYALIVYAGFLGYTNSKSLKPQVTYVVGLRAFVILWAGFIIAIPFAQLLGNGEFLQAVLTADYSRDYKRIIEEVSELMGYLLMLLATVEIVLQIRSDRMEAT